MPTKNLFYFYFICLLLFEGTFTSFFKDKNQKESQNSRNQGFSYYFCMLIEGSRSIPLTNGSGSGKPKSMWTRWIRIRNTALKGPKHEILVAEFFPQSNPSRKDLKVNQKIKNYFGLCLRFAILFFGAYEPYMLTNCHRMSLRRLHNLFPQEPSRFFRAKKWRISGPNQNNFKFFKVFFKSPTYTGLNNVKNMATNISCLGLFNASAIRQIYFNTNFKFLQPDETGIGCTVVTTLYLGRNFWYPFRRSFCASVNDGWKAREITCNGLRKSTV